MKRNRTPRRSRLANHAEELARLAQALAEAGSLIETQYWETRLGALIDRLLADGAEEQLNAALDHLYQHAATAFNVLADLIDAGAEARRIEFADREVDVLLIAVPILAWSRYVIPSGTLPSSLLDAVRVHLQAHVCAADARLALANVLFSPDQLPQGFCETAALAEKLGRQALHNKNLTLDAEALEETVPFLSDSRYLLGALTAPRGAPLFRWQEDDGNRDEATRQWRAQGGAVLRAQLPACACEFLLPQSFFAACRETDRLSRPYALQASSAFLQTVLNLAPHGLRAVIAPFYEEQLEEYRIGFTQQGANDVIHGVVWPLLESEDENSEVLEQIEAALKDTGITDVLVLDTRFPLEFCDDCGTPLYPNPEGEPVHAELPEDQAEATPKLLH